MLNDVFVTQKIIKSGAIHHLAEKTHSVDDEIRLNALWVFRNAVFNALFSEKVKIMEALTWEHYVKFVPISIVFIHADISLCSLTQDSDSLVREQALVLLQNIAITDNEVDFIFDGLGTDQLAKILQQALSSNHPNSVEHVS